MTLRVVAVLVIIAVEPEISLKCVDSLLFVHVENNATGKFLLTVLASDDKQVILNLCH